MPAVLALDLGGTVLKAGVVDEHGQVLVNASAPSAERRGLAAWLESVRGIATTLLAESPVAPAALGVSVPGAVDASSGRVIDLVERLDVGADGVCLADELARLGLPVFVDNDARAALAAERRWGVAKGVDDVALLTLGTGVGGAVVMGGSPPGGHPLAGNQLGHLTIDLDGPPCVCGNHGCAETYASATGLLRLAGAGFEDARAVFAAATAGDGTAVAAVARFTDGLAALVVSVVHAYQPELVVLGGGLTGSASAFLPVVRERLASRAWTLPRGRVTVAVTALPALGVSGAAAVAFAGLSNTEQSTKQSRRAS